MGAMTGTGRKGLDAIRNLWRAMGPMRPAWLWGVATGLTLLCWLGLAPLLFGHPSWSPLDLEALADLSLVWVPHPISATGTGLLYWVGTWTLAPAAGAGLWWRLRRGQVRLRLQIREQERRAELMARDAEAEMTWEAFLVAEQAQDLDAQLKALATYEDQMELALLRRPERKARLDRLVEAADRIGRSDPGRAAALLKRADALVLQDAHEPPGLWAEVRHDVAGFSLGTLMGVGAVPVLIVGGIVLLGVALFTLKVAVVIAVLALLFTLCS